MKVLFKITILVKNRQIENTSFWGCLRTVLDRGSTWFQSNLLQSNLEFNMRQLNFSIRTRTHFVFNHVLILKFIIMVFADIYTISDCPDFVAVRTLIPLNCQRFVSEFVKGTCAKCQFPIIWHIVKAGTWWFIWYLNWVYLTLEIPANS